MNIESLQIKCIKSLLSGPLKAPSIPFIPCYEHQDLLNIAKKIFQKNEKLNDCFLSRLFDSTRVSLWSSIDLRHWTISSATLSQLGKNLTKLCLSKLPGENDSQKLNDILSSNPNLEVLELNEITLADGFFEICKELKNLKVLKLKQCTGVNYSNLFYLFSNENSIMRLDLPPLDLNDERFPELLKKCGKNLQHLSIEHREKSKKHTFIFRGRKFTKVYNPNLNEIKKKLHLYKISEHCPHLKSLVFVNINIFNKNWALPNSFEWKDANEDSWKNILGTLRRRSINRDQI